MQKFRVGIIGAGYVSAHHLRALRALEDVEAAAICDVEIARAQAVAKQFGVPMVFPSLEEMSHCGGLDAVHVLTPPASHCFLSVQALEAGFHVLVEKPMAETSQDCARMITAARQNDRVLAVNHSGRMDPVILRAAEIVHSGACGTILGVDFFRSSDYPPYRGGPLPAPYRKASYPFQDLGIHGLSIIETFLGNVQSADVDFHSTGSDINLPFDEWRAIIHCERGIGHMYLSWNARPIRSEIFVHGTKGSIHVDCFLQTCQFTHLLPGPKFLTNVFGALRNSAANLVTVPYNVLRFATGRLQGAPGIHVSVRDFYQALAAGQGSHVAGEEGRRLISVIQPACERADEIAERNRNVAKMPLAPIPILVTGASGFLGRRLVSRLLERGHNVRVLVRHAPKEWIGDERIQIVEGDLGNPEIVLHAISGVNTVFHVGAAMKGGSADHERGTVWGTRNVIDACLQSGVQALIHVSSVSVLDHAGRLGSGSLREDAPYEPKADRRGFYTQAKLEAEQMVRSAVEKKNLPAVILRPGQIFGPGAERATPAGTIGLGNRWVVVGNGDRTLPLVYVDDVVDALELAAENRAAIGNVFNIVDPEKVTQREYLQAVRSLLPAGVRVHYVPEFIMMSGAIICEFAQKILKRNMPLSRYRVRSIRPLHSFDISKAKQILNWTPAVGTKAALASMSSSPEISPLSSTALEM